MKTEKTIFDLQSDKFIDELRTNYEIKGLTQDKIAESAGLQRQTINRFFAKKYTPRLDLFLKIVDAVGCEIKITQK